VILIVANINLIALLDCDVIAEIETGSECAMRRFTLSPKVNVGLGQSELSI